MPQREELRGPGAGSLRGYAGCQGHEGRRGTSHGGGGTRQRLTGLSDGSSFGGRGAGSELNVETLSVSWAAAGGGAAEKRTLAPGARGRAAGVDASAVGGHWSRVAGSGSSPACPEKLRGRADCPRPQEGEAARRDFSCPGQLRRGCVSACAHVCRGSHCQVSGGPGCLGAVSPGSREGSIC